MFNQNLKSSRVILLPDQPKQIFKILWRLLIPFKFQFFMWRLIHNICPTIQILFKRGIVHSPICLRCGEQVENLEHLFLECFTSKRIWRISQFDLDFDVGRKTSFLQWIENWFSQVIDHRFFFVAKVNICLDEIVKHICTKQRGYCSL